MPRTTQRHSWGPILLRGTWGGGAGADGDCLARTSRSIQLRNSSRTHAGLGGGLRNCVPDHPSCPAVPDGFYPVSPCQLLQRDKGVSHLHLTYLCTAQLLFLPLQTALNHAPLATQGLQSLHSKVQIWIISVKVPDRNNWLLQNLFLIKMHNMHNKSTQINKVPFAFKIH